MLESYPGLVAPPEALSPLAIVHFSPSYITRKAAEEGGELSMLGAEGYKSPPLLYLFHVPIMATAVPLSGSQFWESWTLGNL